ncbi:MAG: 2-isopropylmalate synthase [SAR324 cluster bacterium]|nr:2-isopropylmalate synthase [SAR324 cluster bacterium]
MPFFRYQQFPPINLPDRKWPNRHLKKAPIWCSVDLRDGNQALINPMSIVQKLIFFDTLVEIGFKEIEVGFPAASSIEYGFIRHLIEKNKIPDDVTIQVLCQARPELIKKTIKSLAGAKKAIFHLYNSTSQLQRRVVFQSDKQGVKDIATKSTLCVKEEIKNLPGCKLTLQYSPESFTGTELDYSLAVLEAVSDAWQPSGNNKIILNLPATVEMSTPNVYADMIEWVNNNLSRREQTIISVHTHNDRGCAIAATELAILAGADRVEGTLFGNGERTGNVDLVTLACNLYSQGIDPALDFTDINKLVKICSELTNLPVHVRHPYAGELVYTAFSGSHQDAIRKGIAALANKENSFWEVPYLPVDPKDLGRIYEPIRINSQSGKGGIAFILEHSFGYQVPKKFQPEISKIIQSISEKTGKEVLPRTIKDQFEKEFVNIDNPLKIKDFQVSRSGKNSVTVKLDITLNNQQITQQGVGNGLLDAIVKALSSQLGLDLNIEDYIEHSLGQASSAAAACYVGVQINGKLFFGVGTHSDTSQSSFLALVSGINRYFNNLSS